MLAQESKWPTKVANQRLSLGIDYATITQDLVCLYTERTRSLARTEKTQTNRIQYIREVARSYIGANI